MTARVVNLWAGPGAGKSTTAAGLFFEMKSRGLKVELVREFAKELTYAGRLQCRSNQLVVLAEMDRRIQEVINDVDYVITDSPLPVGLVYGQGQFKEKWFEEAVMAVFGRYENINVFVDRAKPFQAYGRTETEAEARVFDGEMRGTMARLGIYTHLKLAGLPAAPNIIANHLERTYADTH